MLNLPRPFIDKYQVLLGDEAGSFFHSLSDDPQKGFRVNSLKENVNSLEEVDRSYPIPFIKDGYYGTIQGHSLAHQTGYVYSQDVSAMYVGQVVDAQPGEKILDLCAAPGGKSTHIAQQLHNQGLLVSNEINRKRAAILVENIERFGSKNVIILNEDPAQIAKNLAGQFDKVLVDAPCSGEGMFRKDHQAMKYWNSNYPAECAVRQKKILAEAVKTLKPGGELIYSTCTFSPEEDEQIVSWLIDNYSFQLIEIPKYEGMDAGKPEFANDNPELLKTVRLMPHHFRGEGQFIAKLRLENTLSKPASQKRHRRRKGKQNFQLTGEQFHLWQKTISSFNSEWMEISRQDLKIFNNHLYYYRHDWPDIFSMKYMRPGIYLGEFKKKRFEPSYGLALALDPSRVDSKIEVTEEQWKRYLHGETLIISNTSHQGWVLLTCNGIAFSFGKVVGNTIKNFIPKGIRF